MKQKRSRGRPKGTEINDGRYLDQIADLILKEPELKKTPAITRVVAKNFPEHQQSKTERRLLRKWNRTREERMNAARERRADARRDVSARREIYSIGDALARRGIVGSVLSDHARGIGSIFEEQEMAAKRVQDLLNPPIIRLFEEQEKLARQVQDILNPPLMRQIYEQNEARQRILRGF